MAKRREERYRFDASEKKIFISDRHTQNDILLIVNATDGIIIANQLDSGKGFSTNYYPLPVDDVDWKYSTDGYTSPHGRKDDRCHSWTPCASDERDRPW